jgi:hypothetical protein
MSEADTGQTMAVGAVAVVLCGPCSADPPRHGDCRGGTCECDHREG